MILVETDETKDLLGLKEPAPAVLPPEAIKAIQDAGYREDIVMGDDLDIDLNTETERPYQVTETTLHNNQLWIDSAKALMPLFLKNKSTPTSRYAKKYFGAEEDSEIEISDLEASQWGIELMGQFNWNLTDMVQMALKMQDAPKRQRYAFYNLMQSYEKLPNFTYDGSVRMMKGLLSDITTYVGAGTLGYGLAARHSAKFAGKKGIKNYLRATLPASVVAGIEGGAYSSLDDAIRQNVKIEADQQDEFLFGQNLLATGAGGAAGMGVGLAFPKVAEIGFSAAKKGLETFRAGLDNMVSNAKSGTFNTGVGPVDTNVTKKIDVQNREVRERKQIKLSDEDRATINKLSSENTIPAKEIEAEYRRLKQLYPERDGWQKFTIADVKRDRSKNLDIKVQKQAYGFNKPKGAKQAPAVPDRKMVDTSSNKMVDEVAALYKRAEGGDKAAQNIIEHKTWYSNMRNQLRAEFGSMADVFADVIGATSAQTNVRQNWENSIEVMQKFSRGDYDDALTRLSEWLESGRKLGSGKPENDGYVDLHMRVRNEAKAKGATDQEAFDAGQAAYPLITKDNGKLINANSPQTMLALLDLFRNTTTGGSPKTYNFTGNLIGYSDLATIDVWAGRFLQRISGGKRLIPKAEQGVSGKFLADSDKAGGEFGFGQEVFTQASRKLKQRGIELADDDLQAVVWFMEKELWAQKGYTTRAGEGGSLEFEAALAGAPDQEAIKAARKDVDTDPSFRQREQIKAELADPKATEDFNVQSARLAELDGFIQAKTPVQKRKWVMENLGIEDPNLADEQVAALRQEIGPIKRAVKKRENLQPRLDRLTQKQETAVAEGEKLLQESQAPVRRFTAGASLDTEKKIATDVEMSDAQKRLVAPLEPDPSVIAFKNTSTIGRYIDPENEVFDERALDFEYVTRQDHNPDEVVKQLVQEAKDANQESTFFSEVVKPNTVEGANGGMEIYFNRTLEKEDVDKLIGYINKQNLGVGYTFATDFRFAERTSKGADVGDYVGLRMQYIPEFGGGKKGMLEARDKMQDLVEQAPKDMDFISNIRYAEFDTEVFFRDKGDYDAELTGSLRQSRRARWRR
tara:strand:- start:5600 stop:8848 length:3249 start_codon:yes stop_codon:yes gene_type:complete